MLQANYHTHTTFCDGKNTAEEMVQEAISRGFKHLGFSGHMDPDVHMDIQAYYKTIRALQEKYKNQIDILMGVELDTIYDPNCANECEYIIGSTHFLEVDSPEPWSVDHSEEILKQLCELFFSGDYYALSKAYYEVEAKVVERLHPTFIGHFDLVTRFNDSMHFIDEENPKYYEPALETMQYLVSQGVPFEINCGAVNRNRKKELYPNMRLLKALHDFGGQIVINSDAHNRELIDGGFDQAIVAAQACGFTHTNILVHDHKGQVQWKQLALDTLK